jgi:hypothetical protein
VESRDVVDTDLQQPLGTVCNAQVVTLVVSQETLPVVQHLVVVVPDEALGLVDLRELQQTLNRQ